MSFIHEFPMSPKHPLKVKTFCLLNYYCYIHTYTLTHKYTHISHTQIYIQAHTLLSPFSAFIQGFVLVIG